MTSKPFQPSLGSRRSGERRIAFTLVEMLAVISILVLLLALGVPAIGSLIRNSERSLAENQLRVAMTSARDAAIRSTGRDAAAVFFFREGRTIVIPCVSVGLLEDDEVWSGGAQAPDAGHPSGIKHWPREVFVPLSNSEPIRMPKGWTVRGYAPPGSLVCAAGCVTGAYDNPSMPTPIATDGHWVFPETDFYNVSTLNAGGSLAVAGIEGSKRDTFMVRFEAGSGSLSLETGDPILVLDPCPVRAGGGFRATAPYNDPAATQPWEKQTDVMLAASPEAFVLQVLGRHNLGGSAQQREQFKAALIGDRSPDTVLAISVTELALCDEGRLASALGASRLNVATSSMYGVVGDRAAFPTSATIDTSIFPAGTTETNIQTWIDAYIVADATALPDANVPLEARVFTLQRYMGQLQELTPEVAQ